MMTSYRMTDTYTPDILRRRFNAFKLEVATTKQICESTGLHIRCQNPPEDITENIAKFVIRKCNLGPHCKWAKCVGKEGDLVAGVMDDESEGPIHGICKIEVKAFMSTGPCSFGPRKEFDRICFVDLRNMMEDDIQVWYVNLTNNSHEWKNMKVNKNQTFQDQCAQGRRPHIEWAKIYSQIQDHCVSIYHGTFEGIFTEVAPVDPPLA